MSSRLEPPDWLLERYLLGEVSPEQRSRVEQAMEHDPEVKRRLAALETDGRAVLAAHPPARVAASIKAQAALPTAPRRLRASPILAALAALLVGGVVVTRLVADPTEEVRLKGAGASLTLFRLTREGPEPLSNGAEVKAGDVVQARFHLDKRAFVTLLSFDALGQVTIHSDDTFEPGSHVSATSFELDRTPGFERFVLVSAPTKLSTDQAVAAAQLIARSTAPREAPLALPKDASQTSFVLLKKVLP